MVKWINIKRKRGKVLLAILMMALFLLSTSLIITLNQCKGCNAFTSNLLYFQITQNPDLSYSKDYEIEISTEIDTKGIGDSIDGCLTLQLRISSFSYEEGLYYFDGCKFLQSDGLPVLPYIHERFILPYNSIIEDLQVEVAEQEYLYPEYLERFAKTGTQLCDGECEEPYVQNFQEIFPDEPVIVSDKGSVTRSGVDLWHIEIYPFRVLQNETVLLDKEMTIRIYFESDNTIAKFTNSDFATNALSKFSDIVSESQLYRGLRTKIKGTPSFIVIGDPAIHSMAVATSFYWTPEGQKHYGLICLKPNETGLIPEFSLKLQEMGFNEPQIIDSPAELLALIEFSWNHAPYMVIADERLSIIATTLAGFLNYPLVVHPTVSNDNINGLISQLGASGIISCGDVPNIDFGNMDIMELADEEEVNQFLYTFQYQTGFIEKEFTAYHNQFLATLLNGHDYTLFTDKETQTRQGVTYLVCVDNSSEREFVTAAQMLANYRGAQIVDIGGNTSDQIRSLLDSYDPLYVAFYGDGDDSQAGCYFVSDPTGDTSDPGLIATDFYYAERDECQPGGTWSHFSVDSYVGRPISTDDYYAQLYVDLIAAYENGSLPDYNFTKRCALFSWGFGWEDATSKVHDKLVAAGANYHPIYKRGSGTFTEGTIIWELENNGIQIAYFNTHGNYGSISTGDGGSLTDYDLQGHSFANNPPFVFVDSCLTARFAGNGGSQGTYDDDSCIATQFMKYGILGYLGSTMDAYVGDFDRFDKFFFDYFKVNETVIIGQVTGLALEDFYSGAASNGLDSYEMKTILEVMLIADPKLEIQFGGERQPTQFQSLLLSIMLIREQSGSVGIYPLLIFGAVGLIGIVIIAIRGTGKYAEPVDWYTPESSF